MKIFEYDSPMMQFITLLCNLTLLNIIWFVGCIPIVTVGASTVGLYYSADQLRRGDPSVWKNYRAGWKLHWKQASVIWALLALILIGFYYDFFLLLDEQIWGSSPILTVLAVISLATAVLMAIWIFPLMINFRGTVPELIGNAFIFAFMYAPLTLLGVGMYGLLFWLLLKHPIIAGVVIVFAVALIVYITLGLTEKAFQRYQDKME